MLACGGRELKGKLYDPHGALVLWGEGAALPVSRKKKKVEFQSGIRFRKTRNGKIEVEGTDVLKENGRTGSTQAMGEGRNIAMCCGCQELPWRQGEGGRQAEREPLAPYGCTHCADTL